MVGVSKNLRLPCGLYRSLDNLYLFSVKYEKHSQSSEMHHKSAAVTSVTGSSTHLVNYDSCGPTQAQILGKCFVDQPNAIGHCVSGCSFVLTTARFTTLASRCCLFSVKKCESRITRERFDQNVFGHRDRSPSLSLQYGVASFRYFRSTDIVISNAPKVRFTAFCESTIYATV